MFFMQVTIGSELVKRLPAFNDLIYWYGPFLTVIIILGSAFIIMQFVWYKMVINAKNEEIKRLVKMLSERDSHKKNKYRFKK